jgi:hypothetical protein
VAAAHTDGGSAVVKMKPGAQERMILALALHLDPVFVDAHHVARVFTVTLSLPIFVRALAPAKKSKSGRPLRSKVSEIDDAVPRSEGLSGQDQWLTDQ